MATTDVQIPDWGKAAPAGGDAAVELPDWGKPSPVVATASPTTRRKAPAPAGAIGAPGQEVVDDKALATEVGKDLLSGADLVGSIPAQVLGVAGDINTRLRAGSEGESHKVISAAGNEAFRDAMAKYGQPFSRLLSLAGVGTDGEESSVDAAMGRLTDLLQKGGEWVEKKTGGAINADDVNSLANLAMAAGAGKGLRAGVEKLAKLRPDAVAKALTQTPAAEETAKYQAAQQSEEPSAPHKMAEEGVAATQKAAEASRSFAGVVVDPLSGEIDEVTPPLEEGPPKGSVPVQGPHPLRENPSLLGALEKTSQGRPHDMTAAERIAYRDFLQEEGGGVEEPPVDEQGNITNQPAVDRIRERRGFQGRQGPLSRQRGSITLGVGEDGGEEPYTPMSRGSFRQAIGDDASLGLALNYTGYTLKTLERLPKDKSIFSRSVVENEMKRADVTDPERAVLQQVLDKNLGKEKLTAKELVEGVKEATADYELTPKETDHFAEYGLENIDRQTENMRDDDSWADADEVDRMHAIAGEVPARTTLYHTPDGVEVGTANHFDDPNLFGWTRSFDEGGVRHVVEIQSDLAQKAGKTLTEEERRAYEVERNRLQNEVDEINARYRNKQWPPYAFARLRELNVGVAELDAKLKSSTGVEKISPILKNWYKRLVREEIARAKEASERGNESVDKALGAAQYRLDDTRARLRDPAERDGPDGKWLRQQAIAEEKMVEVLKVRQQELTPKVMRFATADTVAKVEGWPDERAQMTQELERAERGVTRAQRQLAGEEPESFYGGPPGERLPYLEREATSLRAALAKGVRFSPEHQSIYDRYKRDIEKFLRQQGGKDYTDEHGHTWIEVPLPKRGGPKQMFGQVPLEMQARLAALGLGAWAGVYFSDEKDLEHALLGAAAGLALSYATPKKMAERLKELASPDARVRIDDFADNWEEKQRLAAIDAWALQRKMEEDMEGRAERAQVVGAVDAGTTAGLPPKLARAAQRGIDFIRDAAIVAQQAHVLESAHRHFVSSLWDWGKNKDVYGPWRDSLPKGAAPSLAQGKAAGLVPRTEDPSALVGMYSAAVVRAIADKEFTTALRNTAIPLTGMALAMPAAKAPHSYVSVSASPLLGLKFHPDIAPSLELMYDTAPAGPAMKVAQGISDTSKRVAVSVSLFHAKALTDAMIGGSSNPFKALTRLPGFIAGTDSFLQELKKGSASPLVRQAVRGGLKFSLEGEGAGVEDAGGSFYGTMKFLEEQLDRVNAGGPIRGFEELNHKVDTLMWARLHAGMKLHMFAEKYQQLMENAAKSKNPAKVLSSDQAARMAASYTNDLFGGLNWRRIADGAMTRFGRELGQATLTPQGRRVLQLLAFAPDWTISTTRAALKAFGGRPDFISPTTLAGLHQQYLIRSALYYLVVGDAINYTMSGHHLWQNKNKDGWTVIEMDPKGERVMQWSKHTMEPVHWVTKPGQQAINKLGILPREAAEQALGVDYLSAKGRMPPIGNRVEHVAKNFSPIAVQQGMGGSGTSGALSGFAGIPIYGKTAADKRRDADRRRREREAEKRRHPK